MAAMEDKSLYIHTESPNYFSIIKPVSSEKDIRQRRVDRLTQEDRRRFEEMFLPYLDAAYNLARWIIQHDQDAQDVVQEAYIRASKGFRRFHSGNSRGWFLTIVRNAAYYLSQQACCGKKPNPLYELEGLSYKEFASTLGVPVGTVMSRLSRARRRLQERSDFGGVEHEL
jgi:DNA-directed RNA polymerase specialized sigma24 family protein